ncbi:putative exported protein of unknown function [Methylobacterium sp. 4-46]|uniref:hypothetical protein n=1 Tax=unclassified Methylobacterium TaxID=2615210 RepID=UPI000152E704|nr:MULTISPECIES: hypothetical protein [Methylobacterium]ACA15260.1 putative exported protein of unknown function [Methylobacterium sp. 4-46]WFT80988.1 hypothetical protein QA634_03540 [Methylobacterium nodulans]
MTVLLAALWPTCLVALLLGAGTGWLAGRPAGRASRLAALAVAALAGLAAGVAASGLVPGRAGLAVEVAALLLIPYAAGCGLGALRPRRARAAPPA